MARNYTILGHYKIYKFKVGGSRDVEKVTSLTVIYKNLMLIFSNLVGLIQV